MTGPRWDRLEAAFHAAIALPPERRAELVRRAAGGDAAMEAEVLRLIAAHEREAGLMDLPAAELLAEPGLAELIGRRLGPYRVVREIARGGMGAVFLADRDDGQYDQRVAIKVIKRGMDTAQVLARFRAERQILASLDHPNIARLLDGGTTDDGLPFFVMEYIDGERIDSWCASRGVGLARRLELFLLVCDAVSYAHQHLVVHRDIKPLNLLVTVDGIPKLLDFGIAKLLTAEPDETTSTVTGFRLLTPEYASPEQIEGRHATTASDVYSLGVVLYELMTGGPPYRFASRSLADIAAAVCTTDPLRPSAAVSDPAARRSLRGDVDTIVLTALRKEPERRYRSVEALAGDIRRYLAGLPVEARTDALGYRAGKFIRRNRASVAAAVAVLVALIGGTAATAWQAAEARSQARLAQAAQARAERRFNDVRQLANAVLFDYHDAIRDLPGSTPVRERLVRDALRYLDTLALEARGDAALQRELAAAYGRVGEVQGGSASASLGDTEGAAASYRKALSILDDLLRTDPQDSLTRRAAAGAAAQLGALLMETGDVAGTIRLGRRAQRLLEPMYAASPRDAGLRHDLNRVYSTLGAALLETGDLVAARDYQQRNIAVLDTAAARDPRDARVRRALAVALHQLAEVDLQLTGPAAALPAFRRAREVNEALANAHATNADYRRLFAASLYWEAEALSLVGRPREALGGFRRSLAIGTELADADPANRQARADLDYAHVRIGDMLAALGDELQALESYRRTLLSRTTELANDPTNLWKRIALIESGTRVCRTLAAVDPGSAPATCRETAALLDGTAVDSTSAGDLGYLGGAYSDLGDAYERLGDRRAAHALHARSYGLWAGLARRGVISPVDTARVSLARAAMARTSVPVGR